MDWLLPAHLNCDLWNGPHQTQTRAASLDEGWKWSNNMRIFFHIFPDVLCVLKFEIAIGTISVVARVVVANTCKSAPSEGASLKLDSIFIEWKIRISFVWSLVSAFLRVIHIQWCVPCTILGFTFRHFELSNGIILPHKWRKKEENLMKNHIIYDNSVRILLRLL